MALVTTEAQEDGTSKVIETAFESPHNVKVKSLENGAPFKAPPMGDLSKLFAPKNVIEIVTEDGTSIEFMFKRIDPMTLLIITGSPISVAATNEGLEEMQKLQADLESKSEELSAAEFQNALTEVYSNERVKKTIRDLAEIKKAVIQAGITEPEMTDEIYEQLDNKYIDPLYNAIIGGVTADNQATETFREQVE